MEALVRFLTRRRSGNVGARDHEVSCELVRFGRSADSEAYLPDPRIRLHHATLHLRPHGLFFEAAEQADLTLNDQACQAATVKPGDRIGLGPYEIVIIDPPPGKDLAVTVELLRQLGDDLQQLEARSRTSLEAAGLGQRRWSWALALLVLGLFLIWPVVAHFTERAAGTAIETPRQAAPTQARIWPMAPDLAWDTGQVSGPHGFFAANCGVCHQTAFVRVQDAACVACHTGIQHHADPARFTFPELTDGLCQSCHKEHTGLEPIVRTDQAFCAGCHGRLQASAANTDLRDASDFGVDHPQFRPAVVVDAAAGKRQRLEPKPPDWRVERSNLKFPHHKHLKAEGLRVPAKAETKVLKCGDCHRPDPGGGGLQPIDMKRHCAECHRLQFEATAPDRVVPHGDVKEALLTVQEFYARMALRGGVAAPEAPPSVRRRPGTKLTEAARLEALGWARQRAAQAADYLFGRAVCKGCHEVTGPAGGWRVKPVLLADRWLLKGRFDHGRHETMDCVECHRAPDSQTASDVLLPGIENCQQCHGGERAADRVPSTCITCHEFHQPFLGPMRPGLVKAAGGAS
ncbi:MAG: FHA domain-containing protein [Kiloniellales bacterium]